MVAPIFTVTCQWAIFPFSRWALVSTTSSQPRLLVKGRLGNGIPDGILDADGGGADEFDLFVGVCVHEEIIVPFPAPVHEQEEMDSGQP